MKSSRFPARRPWAVGLPVLPLLPLFLAAAAGVLGAQTPDPITYDVTFPDLAAHYTHVEAHVPPGGQPTITMMMAIWSPGYYKVENYAQNVDSVRAMGPDGSPLAVQQTQSNRWQVDTHGNPMVTLQYRVKSDRKFVTADWVGDSLIVLCGAPTYMTLLNDQSRPAVVDLTLPAGWTSATSMDTASDHVPNHYQAADYDELVDSPIVAGELQTVQFDVAGKTHLLVDAGDVDGFDAEKAGRALYRYVNEAYRFWGFLPYKRYVFLNVFRPGGGGLEHKGSTLLTVQAKGTETTKGFERWLTFVAHEYFHAYNVKRLRPVALGPFDYEKAPETPSLWEAEGLTTYYADLLVERAGLARRSDWMDWMSTLIAQLQNTPGRLVQTLSQSSLDVWNSQASGVRMDQANTVSYYTTGTVVGLLLDAHIRDLTNDAKSLDDVMRAAYAKYSGAVGYTPEQFQAVASEVAGTDLTDWFHKVLDTTQELDYQDMLDWYGLQFTGVGNRTERWQLREVDKPTPDQQAHLQALLRPDTGTVAPPAPAVRPDTGGRRAFSSLPGAG